MKLNAILARSMWAVLPLVLMPAMSSIALAQSRAQGELPERVDGSASRFGRGKPQTQSQSTTIATSNKTIERVRSFLRQVCSGKYPDYVSEYIAAELTLRAGDKVETVTVAQVSHAINGTLAQRSRKIKLGQFEFDDGVVRAGWNSLGTKPQDQPTLLNRLFADGEHAATFQVSDDGKITNVQW